MDEEDRLLSHQIQAVNRLAESFVDVYVITGKIGKYKSPPNVHVMSSQWKSGYNILNALRELKNPCVATLITSDKCYQNLEWVWGYRESDRLGGNDPYSSSKASAELAIHSYVNSYFSKEKSKVRKAR